MHPLQISTSSGARLVRRARELPVVADPAGLLAAFGGEARGFWGRGERWVAWGGVAARIEVRRENGVASRFAQVRRSAEEILAGGPGDWSAVPPPERPRFLGGFSFLDTASRDGVWEGFPVARFVLPRVLLEGRPGSARLIVQTREGEADADARADHLASTLAAGRAGADRGADGDVASRPDDALDLSGERGRWVAAVRAMLAEIGGRRVEKAVLARTMDVRFPQPVDPLHALRFLRAENARAHVFLLEHAPGRVFLGAAPEILSEVRDGRFEATAVAGSIGRGADARGDRRLAARLLGSAKDRSEHRLTVEEMVEVLGPRLAEMRVDDLPSVLKLARIQHLETRIRGRLDGGEDVLSLVEALHPTPAVCGRPRADALELIRGAEPFDRGWYAGPVGWFDPAGDGDFVPALRSAVGADGDWRLFGGAGIVAGSDPDAEWEETALKLEPALRALRAGAGAR